jgi:hypothetical protein
MYWGLRICRSNQPRSKNGKHARVNHSLLIKVGKSEAPIKQVKGKQANLHWSTYAIPLLHPFP